MAISIQRKQGTKNLQEQGKHEVCAGLCLEGYQLSTFGVVEGIDFFATHSSRHCLQAFHVETRTAQLRELGNMGEFSVSKRLIEEETRFEMWFAFVLKLEDGFRFVVLPRNDMQRFLQRKERISELYRFYQKKEVCPWDAHTLRFQLFFDAEGRVFSESGHPFTSFLGLQHLFLPIPLPA
jgi:hypothetical protein